MKVLFIARHFTYFRNFESVVASLAGRGCSVHLAADRDEALGGRELVEHLAARFPDRITTGFTPMYEWGRYRRLARALRLGLDYLRYSDARYEATPKIRERAYERTPLFVLALARMPFRRAVVWMLERLEQAVPRQIGIDAFMRAHEPDVLLITPLIELGSPQLDYLRSARALGIPTALCVWSWDHLSSKALIRVQPDNVIVWNDTQKQEAERFHAIPPERVIVTGAQCFDRWFDRAPGAERVDFCRRIGLPSDRPYILYVCSALFRGSPSESAFVRTWVKALRQSSDPWLRDAGILVRPHPQRLEEWRDPDALSGFENTVVWGSNPVTEQSRSDYFDSIVHSAAVVGLNTSALVEAAIVDRPVYTVLLPEFRESQEGTFHFRYLFEVGGGFLNSAPTLDDHVRQLSALSSGAVGKSNRTFVERFIRPHGIDRPATGAFVDAIERMARGVRPERHAVPRWTYVLRPLVYAFVLAGRVPWIERIYWNPMKVRQQAARGGRPQASNRRTDRDEVAQVHL